MTTNPLSHYKDTLNLLKTEFSMRANAAIREPELQSFWEKEKTYEKLSNSNSGEKFVLHDGPPYANGDLHMGHVLNKVLKDIINKYQLLRGRKVCFVPGWDCHGLPIELKVLQSLESKERQILTPIALRKKAKEYAKKQIKIQKAGFIRWGVWGEWDKPYLTFNKDYEAQQIGVFGNMVLAGHIYRGLKPVHWSPSSRTALAEAELEYPDDHISPSVYVSFPIIELTENLCQELKKQGLALNRIDQNLKRYFDVVIWTTTPWTLPANLGISVSASLEYCVVVDEQNRHLIIAKVLVDNLSTILDRSFKIKATIKGFELEGLIYRNPLIDRTNTVILGGDYITTETGTGLVHTAPGHGVDDFNTGHSYNLPILCPVDQAGTLTSEAGAFSGLNVLKDANTSIIQALHITNDLIKKEDYNHRYPYDWRTKKPTIFRTTEQWFASLEGFRKKALEAIQEVVWIPDSGRNRIESMVKERGDWCISRQRTWGVPIPVFYEKSTGEVLLNEVTLNHIQKLIAEHGSDVWWEFEEIDLLPPIYTAESNRWRKGTDTMDVWFDSGSSWASVTSKREGLSYPADLYLEGSDQHRGWFQSSLLTSTAVNGYAPYKKVITHGFVLDEKGRKMSKSLGNIIDPASILKGGKNQKDEPPYGADILRLWVSSVDYSVDVSIGSNVLKQLADVYRKVRNTSRYLLGNLHDFTPITDGIDIEELPLLDKWMLNRTAEVIDEVTTAFEQFEFFRFFQTLQNFCVVDLSNFYLDIAKDRLYVSAANDSRRRSCQTVLHLLLECIASLIAPVLCHMAEDIWQSLPYPVEDLSVFNRGWPTVPNNWRQNNLKIPINHLRELRSIVNRQLEITRSNGMLKGSLEARVRLEIKSKPLIRAIEMLVHSGNREVDVLRDWLLVSQLDLGCESFSNVLSTNKAEETSFDVIVQVSKAEGSKCERCWHYEKDTGIDTGYPSLCRRCINTLERRK
uniref:isoleucine--tRNA ligase n=1 Tax=Paulinella chromatophora TaxID=39717 RepID=B1X4U7_PAUCH|nr:isoleucyl-tRNA synthetase [Paulinella chromatophora]ACB42966.1 isoleucyl-tRNA synthetase [Paulinella chromatophora]